MAPLNVAEKIGKPQEAPRRLLARMITLASLRVKLLARPMRFKVLHGKACIGVSLN
ncbi:MAG: hypothetical protein HYY30_11130 [Chloroflexi bacterium]|nr:hypothetical protein [Chloroflexota bacterium]